MGILNSTGINESYEETQRRYEKTHTLYMYS